MTNVGQLTEARVVEAAARTAPKACPPDYFCLVSRFEVRNLATEIGNRVCACHTSALSSCLTTPKPGVPPVDISTPQHHSQSRPTKLLPTVQSYISASPQHQSAQSAQNPHQIALLTKQNPTSNLPARDCAQDHRQVRRGELFHGNKERGFAVYHTYACALLRSSRSLGSPPLFCFFLFSSFLPANLLG